MSIEFDISQIQNILEHGIPHAAEIGLKVHEMNEDGVVFSLPYQERFAGNPVNGVLHGGIITTLIDSAAGMCIYAKIKEYIPLATLDLRIDYLNPATPGEDVFTRATCYKVTKQIAFVRAIAYHSDPEDPIANSVGTFMLRSTDTPPLNYSAKRKGAAE
ncbi:PaaI family thioesterase [Sneathiella sp. HT1-7]|uniref:PaaI family thioesterase n=1 Tax=Sneathiella sp. HT1-7 TaxID=2887192 RepID=UPI001D14AC2D|nr:PaaI family thioesterase [Sneathiella sp. HT1-7]MCC3305576.1 PaaI family thioesterase [Sneathiella sp. HT1-7]